MTIREKIITEARTWMGTPFLHQAAVKGSGVGCGTFLISVYGAVGIPVPALTDLGHFPKDWHAHVKAREERYLNLLLRFADQVPTPAPGDIALFKIGRVYSHSAIIIAFPRVIEARWSIGVVETDISIDAALKDAPRIFLSPLDRGPVARR